MPHTKTYRLTRSNRGAEYCPERKASPPWAGYDVCEEKPGGLMPAILVAPVEGNALLDFRYGLAH